jgi:CheY-like chemotaxis protein
VAITLLLVEDDDFVRPALTRALTRTGVFTVIPAANGEQALEIFDAQQVDAILTDLQMPVMDGLTLLGHLLERGSRLPVAVMTGQRITTDLAERLHGFGIAATFTKPVEISTLADELQRAMSPATVGRITGITLFGFLQLIEVERKTGLIVVHGAGQEGRLYFDRGNLVHAHTRRLEGVEAVNDIVAWPDPKLEIFYKRKSRERTIKEPLQHVLMEAARLLDERGIAGGGAAAEDADETQPAVQEALDEAMEIDGALGVALIDSASGMSLGTAGGSKTLNVELAGAGAADFIRAKARDTIEDVMITLGKQYHLIRLLGPDLHAFLYLVLDRERANLGMARHRLATIGRRIAL